MPAIDICKPMPLPPTPPSIEIPAFGILEKASGALDQIPDIGDLIAGFQDTLAVALAPLRRFMEIIEAMMAFDNCIRSIPRAILSLSPQPLYDCLKALGKIIAILASYVPPMAYILTILDLASYCIDIITEVYSLLQRLDAKIGEYLTALSSAQLLGDAQLEAYVRCGLEEVKSVSLNIFGLLAFIKPINDVLLDAIIEKIDNPALREAVQQYKDATQSFSSAKSAIANGTELPELPGHSVISKPWNPDVPVPPLGPLLQAMYIVQMSLAQIYNVLAPLVGREANKVVGEPPSMTYL